MPPSIHYRNAGPEDALTLSVLATQVFLDTYATHGVSRDLAKEASTVYSISEFEHRIRKPGVEITIATCGEHMVGFLDLDSTTQCPIPTVNGLEVLRLYVQGSFQRGGIGAALMSIAERKAREQGVPDVWLTAWSGNARALSFYTALGYRDVGITQYIIAGKAYENRVFARRSAASEA